MVPGGDAGAEGSIRTPDQRLRVFVSSTLKELESERRAVRASIEALHLAPVMFELGARPHPPRELYRSYLAQSDVFVGVYGSQVQLADGRTVIADDNYVRESIMVPTAKVVKGYQPIMPPFQGLVSEEQVIQIIAYLKTLKADAAPAH